MSIVPSEYLIGIVVVETDVTVVIKNGWFDAILCRAVCGNI